MARNSLALAKRLNLAIRHRNGDEIMEALTDIVGWFMLTMFMLCAIACIVYGFKGKQHCFITGSLYLAISLLVRMSIMERNERRSSKRENRDDA